MLSSCLESLKMKLAWYSISRLCDMWSLLLHRFLGCCRCRRGSNQRGCRACKWRWWSLWHLLEEQQLFVVLLQLSVPALLFLVLAIEFAGLGQELVKGKRSVLVLSPCGLYVSHSGVPMTVQWQK